MDECREAFELRTVAGSRTDRALRLGRVALMFGATEEVKDYRKMTAKEKQLAKLAIKNEAKKREMAREMLEIEQQRLMRGEAGTEAMPGSFAIPISCIWREMRLYNEGSDSFSCMAFAARPSLLERNRGGCVSCTPLSQSDFWA